MTRRHLLTDNQLAAVVLCSALAGALCVLAVLVAGTLGGRLVGAGG